MNDFIIVGYYNIDKTVINITYEDCSKRGAISSFKHYYPNYEIINIITL